LRIRKCRNEAGFNKNILPAPGEIFPAGVEICLVILYEEPMQALPGKGGERKSFLVESLEKILRFSRDCAREKWPLRGSKNPRNPPNPPL